MRPAMRVLTVLILLSASARGATFVVAPGGNDQSPGTQEQPFATLEAARDAARKAENGPHRIVVMPGEYFLSATLELDARDNGLTIEAGDGSTATLYGGRLVTGWQADGDKFWSADLPEVKEGKWDFRALVVNGRMPERARAPESGTFLHKTVWDVRYLSSVAGGWERKPSQEELTTMLYDPKDIPATFDAKNAELRVYHMWDESLVGVVANDTERHALTFSTPAVNPPGAFGIQKYVVFNTREGMTHPGQWYLDRTAGKVVYWPLPDEDMTKAKVIAPALERIIRVAGTSKASVDKITLRGLSLQATTTPLKPAGFGAINLDGAVSMEAAYQCALENLVIANVGGLAVKAQRLLDCQLTRCHVHHTGACGVRVEGKATTIAQNHIHDVGVYHPSAAALSFAHYAKSEEEKGMHIYRNEIHDGPYSGIIGDGSNNLVEENLIYRVMRELHDGAAIYGNMAHSILRGNMVRDVVAVGQGYGASAYYLDEGAHDCTVERNVAVGVPRPVHNHIARNIVIRDNVFIVEGDMTLSFARSKDCTFQGNTLYAPGEITIGQPSGIKEWKDNVVFRGGVGKGGAAQPFVLDGAMPPVAQPQRMAGAAVAARISQAPVLDGEIGLDEWPNDLLRLDREPSRWPAGGAPVFAKVAYDDQFLYVAVNVTVFEVGKVRSGAAWGQDDGAEIAIAGKTPDGQPATFILRGFAGGTVQSVADAGAPAAAVERLGKEVRFAAKLYGKTNGGWRGEWAVPLDALGLKPEPGQKIPFNLAVYRSQDEVWRCWEGTLAEAWRLDEAGMLQFK